MESDMTSGECLVNLCFIVLTLPQRHYNLFSDFLDK